MKKMCKACRGAGEVLGGGFMTLRCEECHGKGKIVVGDDGLKVEGLDDEIGSSNADLHAKTVKMDKRSKAYKDAIRSIMDETGFSKEEATKIFDEEMEKLDG